MPILLALLLLSAFIAVLYWLFPHSGQSPDDKFQILFYSIWLLPVLAGAVAGRRLEWRKNLQYAAAWVAITLMLVLAYAYGEPLLAELMPSRARVAADGSMSVRAGGGGHFHIEGKVNGAPVRFMVDTGASEIVLSPRDARRAGLDIAALRRTRVFSTANGFVTGAPVTLGIFEVGTVRLNDVEAVVNGAEMEQSLLGMAFLKRFSSYRVEGRILTLVP